MLQHPCWAGNQIALSEVATLFFMMFIIVAGGFLLSGVFLYGESSRR